MLMRTERMDLLLLLLLHSGFHGSCVSAAARVRVRAVADDEGSRWLYRCYCCSAVHGRQNQQADFGGPMTLVIAVRVKALTLTLLHP